MAVAPPFMRTYRVRFDEAGADGRLRPSGYLRYAQDIAWQHSEAEGYDRAWYAERRSHWLVRSVELRLLARVTYGARLAVSTEVTGWRRVLARRHNRFLEDDGAATLRAEMETDWALLGPTGRPASVPAEIVERFAPGASFTPLRLSLPPVPPEAEVTSMSVRHADVDPMGHLNNAAYVDLVDEAMARSALARSTGPAGSVYRLAYLRPAMAGEDVAIASWRLDDGSVASVFTSGGAELCRATVTPQSPS